MEQQQRVKLSGAIPVCGGGERTEPDGGSHHLIASARSVHLHLQKNLDLPERTPPLLHRKA